MYRVVVPLTVDPSSYNSSERGSPRTEFLIRHDTRLHILYTTFGYILVVFGLLQLVK